MRFFLFFLFCTFKIFGFEYQKSNDLKNYQLLVEGNQTLRDYILKFPFETYECCYVPDLGFFYIDNEEDNIKGHLKKGIYWEGGIGEIIKKYTLPGTIALDLGSHIGIHTLTMSRCVGPMGLVISFEPQKKMYREQYHNLRLNNCSENVVQLPFCVGESEKFVEVVPWNGQGVNEGGAHIGIGGERVMMLPIDKLNLTNVSCIKMDVESYELEVLKGSRKTIIKNRPVVVFEILGNHDLDKCTGDVKRQLDETLNFFTSLGYWTERISNSNDFIAHPKAN